MPLDRSSAPVRSSTACRWAPRARSRPLTPELARRAASGGPPRTAKPGRQASAGRSGAPWRIRRPRIRSCPTPGRAPEGRDGGRDPRGSTAGRLAAILTAAGAGSSLLMAEEEWASHRGGAPRDGRRGWLRELGLGQYEAAFRDNGVDASVLPELTAEDLKEMGVAAVGHRRRLLAAIEALRGGPEPARRERRGAAAPTVQFCDLVGSTAFCGRRCLRTPWKCRKRRHRGPAVSQGPAAPTPQ